MQLCHRRLYVFFWVKNTWMRNYLLRRETLLFFKRNTAIIYEDTATMGSKRPGSQAAPVCSNILGKCYFMLVLSVCCCLSKATVTGDRRTLLWPDKTVAIVGPDLSPYEFTFLCAFLSMIIVDLIQIGFWLTWQSLPWCYVYVLCSPDSQIYQNCFTHCCAKSRILMAEVSQSTLSHSHS